MQSAYDISGYDSAAALSADNSIVKHCVYDSRII